MYQIEFKESVFAKDLKKVEKKFIKKIFQKIDRLKTNPYKENIRKLTAVVSYFRIRAGDYRIIFQIVEAEKKIIIHYIRHRKEVYRQLL